MGGRGGKGAKSYDGKKAWFSINHSILSGHNCAKYIHCMGPFCRPFSRLQQEIFFNFQKICETLRENRRESLKIAAKITLKIRTFSHPQDI
jgi:hypothetical protein